ncbi:Oidioi.mRNA.OKI2018_I69.PAR.g10066.t1.cds [Oikopleura dioica]|uniref:Oidioi.mRNA.OKI2018_I69.PAR.g10066.t1.cds n=1 Tax=Oikopleura dioica TaxID=34765 RepID=A0ABN7RUK9_OIKDI|nr:Oidioi.mRNA.OKI2018_I69.PAR.g10066.t1.cds [Oikopleura dioica]
MHIISEEESPRPITNCCHAWPWNTRAIRSYYETATYPEKEWVEERIGQFPVQGEFLNISSADGLIEFMNDVQVPVLIQAANSQLIQSSKSSGTLEIVTDCIANFSRNYYPEQESAYLSLFDTASRSSLTDGDEFFGASLMKVVVSLSEQNLGQELLQKSETTLEWTERLLEEKQGGKEVQIRCLFAVNNMINETDWTLRREKSKDVIYVILELINFSQEK